MSFSTRKTACRSSTRFSDHRLQHFLIQAQIRNQVLQATVLVVQPFELLGLVDFHPTVLRLPGVDGPFADPDLSRQLGYLAPRLVLLQNADYLLLCEPPFFSGSPFGTFFYCTDLKILKCNWSKLSGAGKLHQTEHVPVLPPFRSIRYAASNSLKSFRTRSAHSAQDFGVPMSGRSNVAFGSTETATSTSGSRMITILDLCTRLNVWTI